MTHDEIVREIDRQIEDIQSRKAEIQKGIKRRDRFSKGLGIGNKALGFFHDLKEAGRLPDVIKWFTE